VGHGRHRSCHGRRLGQPGRRGCVERKPPAGRRYVVDLLHVHLEVVSPLEHLPALPAGVGDEPALVLVTDVPQEGALQVEAPAARGAPVLDTVRGLAHGVDGVLLGAVQPPQADRLLGRLGGGGCCGGCLVSGGGRGSGRVGGHG